MRRLIERGLVYRAGRGAYDFALPLFGDYLRRRPKLGVGPEGYDSADDGDLGRL